MDQIKPKIWGRCINVPCVTVNAYLAMIRQLPCVKCGVEPCGVAAHLRMNSGAYNKRQAMGRKPADSWTTPLCDGCHTNDYDAQHKIGEREFYELIYQVSDGEVNNAT